MYVVSDVQKFRKKKEAPLNILGARKVTCRNFHTEDPQKILRTSAQDFDSQEGPGIFKPLHYITPDEIINI